MIHGIGTDIIEIDRVKNAAANPRFVGRVFTPVEAAYCRDKADPYPSFAVRFAAKEAVYKALYPIIKASAWLEVEVIIEDRRPFIRLHGVSERTARKNGIEAVYISLSHNNTMAQAFAVAVKKHFD